MTHPEKQMNYIGPFFTMVFLFLIVGFLTTANTQFQGPLKETFLMQVGNLKNTFATLITFSWFLAYLVCGKVGSSWINRYGYKGTLIRGLWVMIAGLGLFFASSYFTVRFPEAAVTMGGSVIPVGFFLFLSGSFVVGGAILPVFQGIFADLLGSWRWSWFIVLFGELFMLYYALAGSRVCQTAD